MKAILASSPELKADFDKKLDSLSGKPLADWLSDFLEEHLPAAAAQKIRDKIKKETDRRNKVFKSWVTVRNAGRSLMDAELRGDLAADLYRDALNQTYDAHVKEHGAFSARNSPGKSNPHRFLLDEDDSPLLESLEDEILTGTDEKGKPIYRYEKRPIFTESMQSSAVAPTKAQDIKDAVGISMGYKGRINPLFPRLRSSHELSQRPSPQKQIPSSQGDRRKEQRPQNGDKCSGCFLFPDHNVASSLTDDFKS